MLDADSGMARVVGEEFAAARGDTWSSKDMLELIRRKSQVRRGACLRTLIPSPSHSLAHSHPFQCACAVRLHFRNFSGQFDSRYLTLLQRHR